MERRIDFDALALAWNARVNQSIDQYGVEGTKLACKLVDHLKSHHNKLLYNSMVASITMIASIELR